MRPLAFAGQRGRVKGAGGVTGTGILVRCSRGKQGKLLVSKRHVCAFMFLVLREDNKDDNVEGTMRGREGDHGSNEKQNVIAKGRESEKGSGIGCVWVFGCHEAAGILGGPIRPKGQFI